MQALYGANANKNHVNAIMSAIANRPYLQLASIDQWIAQMLTLLLIVLIAQMQTRIV